MKARTLATQTHGETAGEILKKIVEECEMKATNAITTLNNWLSHSLVRKTPGKVLGALALGGLIMTAAVLTPSSALADEPSRPLGIEASQGFGPVDDMAQAALLDAKQSFWGYGPLDDIATDPSGTSKLDWRLYTNGIDYVEDSPARATKLDWRLYTNGMDFVEETGVGRTSNRVEASQGIGTIFDLAMDALLDTKPSPHGYVSSDPYDMATASSRTPKLDIRLHTNGMDFVDEPRAGKVSYSESVGFGPLGDMIAAAELSRFSVKGSGHFVDFP